MKWRLITSSRARPRAIRSTAIILPILLCLAVTIWHLARAFGGPTWHGLLFGAPVGDIHVAILYYSALPRLAIALLTGAALGMASPVLQVVLRNPVAEPATLGMSGGASLGLSAATLWAPSLLAEARAGVAFVGAGAALLLVLGLALGRGLSPVRLILGGLIVSLLCGTLNGLLVLFHHDSLQGIFIWNAGSLVQNGWHVARRLSIECIAALIFFLALSRALTVLHLDDDSAHSLGLSLVRIRLAALIGALLISASVASAVGVIGFVGLAAATMARASGTRSFAGRLVASAVIGATLLTTVDQGLQILTGAFNEIPAGALTALSGAPLMLFLLPRLASTLSSHGESLGSRYRRRHPGAIVGMGAGLLLVMLWPALALTHDATHWHFASLSGLQNALAWKGPRTVSAICAGFLMGVAGVLTQRLTGNPLSSPEVLGISSGAALGALLCILLLAHPDPARLTAFAALGAILTLTLVFAFARRAQFSPERMLLAGICISTLFSGVVTFLLATGDPRLRIFIGWMAGSLSRATAGDAETAFLFALLATAILPFLRRWLDVLPMGEASAQALGLDRGRSHLVLFIVVAILTAPPTFLAGPLSFVGLMAPHLVRMTGINRPLGQGIAAGVTGSLIMLAADLVGRTILFPYEIPAGLVASLIGAPWFLWLMYRR